MIPMYVPAVMIRQGGLVTSWQLAFYIASHCCTDHKHYVMKQYNGWQWVCMKNPNLYQPYVLP